MDRRSFVKTSAAAFGGLMLSTHVVEALAQGTGPVKIGLLAPLTGVVAAGGKEIVEGFNLYWTQVGGKVAGREIRVLVEDDGSNPDIALQKARKLVEQEGVVFLIGDLLANTGLARGRRRPDPARARAERAARGGLHGKPDVTASRRLGVSEEKHAQDRHGLAGLHLRL